MTIQIPKTYVYRPNSGGNYTLRIYIDGVRKTQSLGTTDFDEAKANADKIVAELYRAGAVAKKLSPAETVAKDPDAFITTYYRVAVGDTYVGHTKSLDEARALRDDFIRRGRFAITTRPR